LAVVALTAGTLISSECISVPTAQGAEVATICKISQSPQTYDQQKFTFEVNILGTPEHGAMIEDLRAPCGGIWLNIPKDDNPYGGVATLNKAFFGLGTAATSRRITATVTGTFKYDPGAQKGILFTYDKIFTLEKVSDLTVEMRFP